MSEREWRFYLVWNSVASVPVSQRVCRSRQNIQSVVEMMREYVMTSLYNK